MKRSIIVLVIAAASAPGPTTDARRRRSRSSACGAGQGGGRGGGRRRIRRFGGGGRGGGPRLPMTVETAAVKRADMSPQITVVGNLIGAATVEATPRSAAGSTTSSCAWATASRRASARKNRGQRAPGTDQAGAGLVRGRRRRRFVSARPTCVWRRPTRSRATCSTASYSEADLRRHRCRYGRGGQLDLAKAQFTQSQARLEELKINLANTTILSPVSGFIGKRSSTPAPGSRPTPRSSRSWTSVWSGWSPTSSKRTSGGFTRACRRSRVDAFPGEKFSGSVAHVAPVLDPATRTAQIEVEIPNPQFRLKPGMYAQGRLHGRAS